MLLPFENAYTLGKVPWSVVKMANNLPENSYLELLDHRIESIIRTHGQTGARSISKEAV